METVDFGALDAVLNVLFRKMGLIGDGFGSSRLSVAVEPCRIIGLTRDLLGTKTKTNILDH